MMAPESYEVELAVDSMAPTDPEIPGGATGTTSGTSVAADVLQPVDGNTGEWGRPDPPSPTP